MNSNNLLNYIKYSDVCIVKLQIAKILFLLLLCACGSKEKSTESKAIFHYNQPNPITSLDPAFAKTQNNYWVCDHLYNQLLDLDDSLRIVPEVAKSYLASDDGLIYTFYLRDDVFFSDNPCFPNSKGRKLTSKDVVFSFQRLLDIKLSAPGRWIFVDKVDSLEAFSSIDDTTFQLKLRKPFSPLLSLLTMHYCSIIPFEAVEYYKEQFRENPVGTGPFVLNRWVDRQGMFLKKNLNYFRKGLPLLDGIRISFIEDRNTAYLEFMKKRIDYFSGVHSSFAPQLINKNGNLREDRKHLLQLVRGQYLNTEYLGINSTNLPKSHALHNKYVRQALNLSIDRELMIKTFKYGIGSPSNKGFIPPGLSGFDDSELKGYSYLPDSARKLLLNAKYENLSKGDKQLIVYTNKDYLDLITFITRQWQEIGIQVQIELLETATLREKMRSGELSLFRASWIADYPDEESFLTVFYGSNSAPPNYTRFKNVEYDKYYTMAIEETDANKRLEYYKKMNRIIVEESPVIFLMYDQIALFCRNNIQGIVPNPINLLKLEKVTKNLNDK